MTARLSESAASEHHAMRVVSVSPMTAQSLEPRDADHIDSMPFHQPHHVERDDDVRGLTRRANEVITSLHSAMDQAAMGDAQTRDSVRSLQDRLRVSARMLQAFQAQITRIEAGITELDYQRQQCERAVEADAARLDDQAAAFEQRLEAALEHFERRLAELGGVL